MPPPPVSPVRAPDHHSPVAMPLTGNRHKHGLSTIWSITNKIMFFFEIQNFHACDMKQC
jgi:hypothetical protein